ncbi:hypothetical protein PIB30_049493 [Stylosanthes scabra]|uniref:Uncharacterized protein n=1 Tax=Stylosanthes scabra TaxID=79078 RepID=A0ABU6SH66_9FABA|nr:hypothetical protein [Stylosanthes scabra]
MDEPFAWAKQQTHALRELPTGLTDEDGADSSSKNVEQNEKAKEDSSRNYDTTDFVKDDGETKLEGSSGIA